MPECPPNSGKKFSILERPLKQDLVTESFRSKCSDRGGKDAYHVMRDEDERTRRERQRLRKTHEERGRGV